MHLLYTMPPIIGLVFYKMENENREEQWREMRCINDDNKYPY